MGMNKINHKQIFSRNTINNLTEESKLEIILSIQRENFTQEVYVMLIRFTVDNFLSFNNEQEFSMNAGNATTFHNRVAKLPEQSILKFTALYGANASGKTNLVKAMDFSRRIIVLNGTLSSHQTAF